MTKAEIESYLKTKEGLRYILYIIDEYGQWNEAEQCYDMPYEEAVELAIAELSNN